MARRILSGGIGLVLLAVSPPTRAEAARVLFVAREQTPLNARIRAEIESMDLQVEPTDTLAIDDGTYASAAVRVIEQPAPRRVELWLRDEYTGKLALDGVLEVEPSEYGSSAADATSAVRVSEQLRAFFQPLRERALVSESSPPRPPPPPMIPRATPRRAELRPTVAVTAPNEERFFQELAAALPLQPGSIGFDLLLRARYRIAKHVGLGAKIVLPVVASTVSSGPNTAEVSASLFGIEVSTRLLTTRLTTLHAHAGLALLLLSASGDAQPPYTNRVARRAAAFPSAGTELGFRLTEQLSLCLGAEVGASAPELELAFAGQRVASWARPLGLLSAGVAVTWGAP